MRFRIRVTMASLARLNYHYTYYGLDYYYTYYGLHDGHAVMRAALAEEVVRVHAYADDPIVLQRLARTHAPRRVDSE